MAKAPTWTDELKAEAIEMYLERIDQYAEDERAKFTAEVITDIAEELEKTPNSVRAILQRAKREDGSDVYVKKASAPKAKVASTGKKLSKADAQAELLSALQDGKATIDDDLVAILEKLTGKAAQALAGAIRSMGEDE